MKIELPDEAGKVISIEVSKHTTRYARRLFKECEHHRIEVDATLKNLICLDCHKEVNPVQWVSMMVEEWHRIKMLTDAYQREAEKKEKRSRVKCLHCGELTPIRG